MTKQFWIIWIFVTMVFGNGFASKSPDKKPDKNDDQTTKKIVEQKSEAGTKKKEEETTEKPKEVSIEFESPRSVIERYTEQLRQMVALEKRKEKAQEDKTQEEKVATTVREFFDFQKLAQLSLGHHWNLIGKSQRNEFSDLFVSLVENSYIRRSRDLVGNYQVSFGKESISEKQATVTCKIAHKDADIDIVYELHQSPSNWMIFNIILDNVNLIRNYQSQFNRIIKKSGFPKLIELMKQKQASGEEPEVVL